MTTPRILLAPGQRYVHPGDRVLDQQVTIVRLEPDHVGTPKVIFLYPGGREVTVYVPQVEEAIAVGQLEPVVGRGQRAAC